MTDEKDKPKREFSSLKATVVCAGAMAAWGLVIGTISGGPAVGIALALIWGTESAFVVATAPDAQPTDVS